MHASHASPRVVGIDVGGPKKGFHAVAMEGGQYHARLDSTDIVQLVTWCTVTVNAGVIAVDAPCRWSVNQEGRMAERELVRRGIRCFSTPTRSKACTHPTGYFDWMLRGEALYQALQSTHPVCEHWPARRTRYCFETFPHAITWHLRGGNADAKHKGAQRRQVLESHGIRTDALTHMDWLDAALCALTAQMAATGQDLAIYGETGTGFIIAPATPGFRASRTE